MWRRVPGRSRKNPFSKSPKTCRIVILCYRPEAIFRKSLGRKGHVMDACCNVAAALTEIKVDLTYFDRVYKGTGICSDVLDQEGYCTKPPLIALSDSQLPFDKKLTRLMSLLNRQIDEEGEEEHEQVRPSLLTWNVPACLHRAGQRFSSRQEAEQQQNKTYMTRSTCFHKAIRHSSGLVLALTPPQALHTIHSI